MRSGDSRRRCSTERTALLALAAVVLAALSLPAVAVGQKSAPTLKEEPGTAFPDRQYLLRLPSPRTLETDDITITENGGPASGHVGVEAVGTEQVGTRPSSEYLVTYRSLLPPEVPVEVRATVEGLPAATARYTTPELVFEPLGSFEDGRTVDISTFQLLAIVVLLLALGLWVFARVP